MSSEENEDFLGFPPESQEAVDGLIYLGELSKEFEFCGHTFGLRTLRAQEEMAAAKAIESFRGTLREPQAFVSAQVGLALTSVDGAEDFCPQAGPNQTAFATARFNYISQNWYWPTIEFLYTCYAELLQKQIEAIRITQDLSRRSPLMFSHSEDSSSGLGTLNDAMDSETQDSQY
jgi:hypothetical protein